MVSLLNPSGAGGETLQLKGENDGVSYIRIISSDNQEFFLDEAIAELCPVFLRQLADCLDQPTQEIKILSQIPQSAQAFFPGSPTRKEEEQDKCSEFKTIRAETVRGEILELVIQYLHYKRRYQSEQKHMVPQFHIPPEHGLDVLKASLDLQI